MSKYNDPTIPKKRRTERQGNAGERGRALFPIGGRLVDYGDRLVLVDDRGNEWNPERVRTVSGGWGSGRSGVQRGPRPWKYGPNNEVLVGGDFVLILFPEGNPERPVILPGVRSLTPDDDSYFAAQAVGENPNRLAMRQVQINAAGAPTGTWDLEAFPDDTGQRMELRVSLPTGKKTRIMIDAVEGTVAIGDGNELKRAVTNDITADIQTLADDLVAVAVFAGTTADGALAIGAKLALDPTAYDSNVKVN